LAPCHPVASPAPRCVITLNEPTPRSSTDVGTCVSIAELGMEAQRGKITMAEQRPSSHPNCWAHILLSGNQQHHPRVVSAGHRHGDERSLTRARISAAESHGAARNSFPLDFSRLLITDRAVNAGIKQGSSKSQLCARPLVCARRTVLLPCPIAPGFSLQSGLHWQNFSQKF